MRITPEKQFSLIELEIILKTYQVYRDRLYVLLSQEFSRRFEITDIRVKNNLIIVGCKFESYGEFLYTTLTFTEEDLNEYICT